MFKVALRGLAAHKLRLMLTALAVVLGVGFISGTFVITDTMNKAFDQLFETSTEGIDVIVRAEQGVAQETAYSPPGIPESVVDEVAAVDGVGAAEGVVQGFAQIVDKEGEAITPNGPPALGLSFPKEVSSGSFTLLDGRAPSQEGEVVLDNATAEDHDFSVGDTVEIIFARGTAQYEIVGIAGAQGEAADLDVGATVAMFDLDTAQSRLLSNRDEVSEIDAVAESGVSSVALRDRVRSALGNDFEIVTGAESARQQSEDLKQNLSFFNTFLLIFAGIAVFVGAFIIFNTFSIVVAQRMREYALLRALGATGRQITASVLIDAIVVGLVASAVGIAAGFAIAGGLNALLGAFGVELPSTGLVLLPRTIVVGFAVGMLVTLVAAVWPARRAARISPMATFREVAPHGSGWSKARSIVGGLVVAAGVGLIFMGLSADVPVPAVVVGSGALLTFVGVSILGPLFAGPLARVIGTLPARLRGMPGALARGNAQRNPKRTSATAAALMIGIALITMFSVLGASVKESIGKSIDNSLKADFIVSAGGMGFTPLSAGVADRMEQAEEFGAVTPTRLGFAGLGKTTTSVTGADVADLDSAFQLDIREGRLGDLEEGGVFVSAEEARNRKVKPGDTVELRFSRTGRQSLPVEGIYGNTDGLGSNYLISLQTWDRKFTDQLDFRVFATVAPGVATSDARRALDQIEGEFPGIQVSDQAEFKATQENSINQILGLMTALLGLALLIAVLGIVNTLVLSVFERTREIGLLRAVGMSRAQTRTMIRWESVVISLIGALLGLAVGFFFGWALANSMTSEGVTDFAVPVGQLVGYVLAAGIVGVIAGMPPARRAARLNVLNAIATE